jgi:hypothetical protein
LIVGLFMIKPSRRNFMSSAIALAVAASCPWRIIAQQQQLPQVQTIAGTGIAGYEPEGSLGIPGNETQVNNPYGVIVGQDGALYFCEVDTGRTRKLDLTNNLLTTVAGNGEKAYVGDGQLALEASFSAPHEIRFDSAGNLFVVERDSHVVRRVDATTGLVSTVAGTGEGGYGGDDGPAVQAQLRQPHSIAFDAQGNLLICDIGNSRVRSVNMGTGVITTLAGTGERAATPDQGPLIGTPLLGPRSIDTDSEGNAYLVLREGNAVYRLYLTENSRYRRTWLYRRWWCCRRCNIQWAKGDCLFGRRQQFIYCGYRKSCYPQNESEHGNYRYRARFW